MLHGRIRTTSFDNITIGFSDSTKDSFNLISKHCFTGLALGDEKQQFTVVTRCYLNHTMVERDIKENHYFFH